MSVTFALACRFTNLIGSDMTKVFAAADHHLFHDRALHFRRMYLPNEVVTLEDYCEYVVEQHNRTVRKRDVCFFLGDFTFDRKGLAYVERMKGTKILVIGNHDKLPFEDYLKAGFDKVVAMRSKNTPSGKILFTHIPVHTSELSRGGGRWRLNVHGHLHDSFLDDGYLCVSLEHLHQFQPLEITNL